MTLLLTPISILTTLALLVCSQFTQQHQPVHTQLTMCHNTTQAFAQLGKVDAFSASHEDPLPSSLQDFDGEMITYAVAKGEPANAYLVKAQQPSDDYLLVIHEWYGLNTYVKNEADKFAKRFPAMNVLALDLYDGKVADNREDARKYMQAVSTERALDIIKGAATFSGPAANLYTIGWCFGGGWSLQAAITLGSQAKGAVMFYGMPETETDRLSNLQCDVLGIFAEQDKWITPEVAANFAKVMDKMPPKLMLKSYDAGHGFANPSNPMYDQEAASDAYRHVFDFISARR